MVTRAAGAQRKGNHGIALCTAAAGGGLSGPEKRVGELSVDIQHHAAGAVNSRSEGIPLSPRPYFWCTLSGVIYFSRNDSAPLLSPESERLP